MINYDKNYSRVIVTTMKDEAPYMLDWIAYHMAIGFTHFVIMTNDCTDGTDKIARHLEKAGLVTHGNNKAPHPKGIQKTAYSRMPRFEAVQKAEWLLALDVDEYLRIDVGNGQLDSVFALTREQAYAISFTWQIFGNNGVVDLIDQPITQQFTRASTTRQAMPYHIRGLKTLFRRDCFASIGTHRPFDVIDDNIKNRHWIDANGTPIPYMNEGRYWCAWNDGLGFGLRLGRINHYAIRSKKAFLLKLHRGFVNATNNGVRANQGPERYWATFDWNIIQENSISRMDAATLAIKLDFLVDSKLKRLHENGVAHHQNLVTKLIVDETDFAKLAKKIEKWQPRFDFENYPNEFLETMLPAWEYSQSSFDLRAANSIFDDN